MKEITILVIAGILCVFAVVLFGQTVPPAADAKTTCITLARLLDVAQRQGNAADSAALSQAYKIARPYAGSLDLKVDDKFVAAFDENNQELKASKIYGPFRGGGGGYNNGGGGGYNNHTIDEFSGLYSTDEHKAAVIVIDKDHRIDRFHSDIDAAAVTNMLNHTEGMHSFSGGKK
jgi:hypothetical protein